MLPETFSFCWELICSNLGKRFWLLLIKFNKQGGKREKSCSFRHQSKQILGLGLINNGWHSPNREFIHYGTRNSVLESLIHTKTRPGQIHGFLGGEGTCWFKMWDLGWHPGVQKMGLFHWRGEKPCVVPTGRTKIPSFPLPWGIHKSSFNSQVGQGRIPGSILLQPGVGSKKSEKSQCFNDF